MITTIEEYIEALRELQVQVGGDHPILVFDRLLTDEEADRLAPCKFDAVHSAIDETMITF
jgi:hypothetical protein